MINTEKDEAIDMILAFVEGTVPIIEFMEYYNRKSSIADVFNEENFKAPYFYPHNNLNEFICAQQLKTCGGQVNIFGEMERYLKRQNIQAKPTELYREQHRFLLEIQPEWLDVQSEEFLINEVINEAPKILSKGRKIKWCKEKIKALFIYDKSPPRWAQNPEWPFGRNGKPLVFRGQSKGNIDCELIKYYFYDTETNEEVTVEQLF